MNIKLYYFDIPFWRAEVIRLSLYISDIKFEDIRIKGDTYKLFKENGVLPNNKIAPFKQLPVLEIDGKILAQTGAIARLCGKISKMYPINDFEAAKVDQIIDAAQDINYVILLSGRDKDPDRKKIAREILSNKHLPKYLKSLENLISEDTKSPWFVGEAMTIADIAIWRLLGWLKSGLLDGVPKNILDAYPNLLEMMNKIYQNPKVIDWMRIKYGKSI